MICFGKRTVSVLLAFGTLLLLAACGGGGGGGGAPAPSDPPAAGPPTVVSAPGVASGQPLISLSSDAGDYVGQGRSYAYDTSNAAIRLTARGARLAVQVVARESWSADFVLPGSLSQLQAGTYSALTRYPFQPVGAGAMSWTGEGRGCNVLSGTLVISAVSYELGLLRSIDLSFEQRCDGSGAALRGRVRVDASQMAAVSPLQNPLSAQPVVALASDFGDYIGGGGTYAYDSVSSSIVIQSNGGHLRVRVAGDESWDGNFQMPGGATALAPGSYAALVRYPFQTAGSGGLSWTGEGRGCNTVVGSATIHAVRYDGAGVLAAIDMSFEQRCEGATVALRGRITWDASAPIPPPGPLPTAPAVLWQPPEGAMPATGNAMYIASDWNDFVGDGYTFWVGGGLPGGVPGDVRGAVTVNLSESAGLLRLEVGGAVSWSAQFKAMDGLARLQPGYYGIVNRYPFHNPARGGLSFSMASRGCNRVSGWFMVDSVAYQGNQLASVDLRFAQYCEGGLSALRGRIRWSTALPGT